jgi:4-hydroxy-tetrahydrodipicolinate reductase
VRLCLYGLGAIGGAVARALVSTPGVEITGAIDTDPAKAGRDLRAYLRLKNAPSLTISDDPAAELKRAAPHAVIHCTGSHIAEVSPQLEMILQAGIPCVSSCEELAFPDGSGPEAVARAGRLDESARGSGVALLGAGVNPGFVMDGLVLALSGATHNVSLITVERTLDPLSRRREFQRKVGIGLDYQEASHLAAEGRLGHVGLRLSALLVARGMGWTVSSCVEDLRIVCAGDSPTRRSRKTPRPGAEVIGLTQSVTLSDPAGVRIRMEMVMVAGTEGPHDTITIAGEPDLNLWIQGGIPGDSATVACLINGMMHVLAPPRPGLLTLLDLPLRPVWRGDAHS